MSSPKNSTSPASNDDTLEIIELASSDLNTLAKAFDLISEVCKEYEQPDIAVQKENDYPVQ